MGAPIWYLIPQLLLTAAIGIGGGAIAFAQWRTAQRKVVLDLFERRMKVFDALTGAIIKPMIDGGISEEVVYQYERNRRDAMFLFGKDVTDYLERTSESLFELRSLQRKLNRQPPPSDFDELSARENVIFAEHQQHHNRLADLCAPYMRMDTKLPHTFRKWLLDSIVQANAE